MDSMTTRRDLARFLKNPENARKFNGLVEDVRYALVDHQVCTPKQLALVATNVRPRPYCNEIYTTKAVKRL